MTTPDPGRDDRDPEGNPQDPEPRTPLDVDTTFAAIVAHWEDAEDESHPWPDQEDLGLRVETTDEPGSPESPAPEQPPLPAEAQPRVVRAVTPDPFEVPPSRAEAELDERFIPPDPGPLPRGDLLSRLAWAGVLGGPLFLLLAAMVWREAPQLFVLIAVGAFIGGFVALVLRLPEHQDDDDGDDGAVV